MIVLKPGIILFFFKKKGKKQTAFRITGCKYVYLGLIEIIVHGDISTAKNRNIARYNVLYNHTTTAM